MQEKIKTHLETKVNENCEKGKPVERPGRKAKGPKREHGSPAARISIQTKL